MDFKNVPNTSSYPVAPNPGDSFNGGVSSGAMDPQAYAGATLNTDEAPKKANKGVFIGIFAMFAVMTATSLGFFVYQNGQSARANSNENKYASLLSQTPNQPGNTSPIPTPTYDLQNYAISLTPTIAPNVTLFPTLENRVATMTPSPAATITPIRGNKWAISFNQMTYSRRTDMPGNSPQAFGTLYTPLEYGKTFCTDSSKTFFTWKKNATTIERLCDKLQPTASQPQLVCYTNSPSGTQIGATLLPTTDCSTPQPPPTGTYILYTKVYYDCDQNAASQTAATCKSTKEVFSDDFNLAN